MRTVCQAYRLENVDHIFLQKQERLRVFLNNLWKYLCTTDHKNYGHLAQIDIKISGARDKVSARTLRVALTFPLPPLILVLITHSSYGP